MPPIATLLIHVNNIPMMRNMGMKNMNMKMTMRKSKYMRLVLNSQNNQYLLTLKNSLRTVKYYILKIRNTVWIGKRTLGRTMK